MSVEVDTPLHTDIVQQRHWLRLFAMWDSVIIQAPAPQIDFMYFYAEPPEPVGCQCGPCRRARDVRQRVDQDAAASRGEAAELPDYERRLPDYERRAMGSSGWGQLGDSERLGWRRERGEFRRGRRMLRAGADAGRQGRVRQHVCVRSGR
jgi:hypothetical protein